VKALSALFVVCVSLPGPALARDLASLEAKVASIATHAGGSVGVGVLHLPSGESVVLRGRESFPMFSVYKLPISMKLLQRVDEGTVRLDQPVTLGPTDLRPSRSTAVSSRVRDGRVTMTVAELIEAAVAASDNSASGTVLRLAGGPAAVTTYVRGLGITDMRVDRPEVEMAADLWGVTLPDPATWTVERLTALFRAPEAQRRAAVRRYLHEDPRDTTTPEAALALLKRVHAGDALRPETAAFVVEAMKKTTTGDQRIRGFLPAGSVANKTGSGPGTTNDIGIVTLPGGAGHLALAVFVRDSPRDDAQRERTIAEIARAAHDHWTH
jgi:beta-lactamase class A